VGLDLDLPHDEAVGAAEVLDLEAVAEVEDGVFARDDRVVDADVGLVGAADGEVADVREQVRGADAVADDQQTQPTQLAGVPEPQDTGEGGVVVSVVGRGRQGVPRARSR
jgi:hypothetical protein